MAKLSCHPTRPSARPVQPFSGGGWASRLVLAVALAGAGAGLSGCESKRHGPLPIALAGDETAFQTAGRLSPSAQVLRAATVEGLVGFDAEGRVIPAIAERWIVTDDGLSYIFRLREGIWPDGTPIDAASVVTALRRARASFSGRALGVDLAPIDDIRAMTDRVVEIDLTAPMPDLLTLLAQPELGLPRKRLGSGPLGLRRDGPDHSGSPYPVLRAALSPIPPERRGLPAQEGFARSVRGLALEVEPMAQAVQRFNDGAVDVALGGTVDTLPLTTSNGLSRGNVQFDPVIGLYGLIVENADGFLSDPARREALALAIDRDGLVNAMGVGGWRATTRLVAPEVADDQGTVGERWAGTTLDQRRALARQRVQAWRAAGSSGTASAPVLRLAAADGPGSRLVVGRLKADFAAIGVTLERVGEGERADLRLYDKVARYARVSWFLDQFACSVTPATCSVGGDVLVAQALGMHDPRARADLLAQAERAVTQANGFIPIAQPVRWSLVRSGMTGFAPNPWGWHSLVPFSQITK